MASTDLTNKVELIIFILVACLVIGLPVANYLGKSSIVNKVVQASERDGYLTLRENGHRFELVVSPQSPQKVLTLYRAQHSLTKLMEHKTWEGFRNSKTYEKEYSVEEAIKPWEPIPPVSVIE